MTTEMISPDELNFLSQKNKEMELNAIMTNELKQLFLKGIEAGLSSCKNAVENMMNEKIELNLVEYELAPAKSFISEYLTGTTAVFSLEMDRHQGKQIILIKKEALDQLYGAFKSYDGAKELDSVKLQNVSNYLERGLQLYYQSFSEILNIPISLKEVTSHYLEAPKEEFTESNLDLLHEVKGYEIKAGGLQIQMIHLSDLDFMDYISSETDLQSTSTPEDELLQTSDIVQQPEQETVFKSAQSVKKPLFSPLEEVTDINGNHDLGLLRDVPLEISVVLGKTKRSIQEILEINPGKIIELDKYADDPLEIYCNGKLIAEGEAVVIDGNFGVKVTKFFQSSIQNFR